MSISTFKSHIENGEGGYSSIVDSFWLNDKGSLAWVIMVNPLHDKLPVLSLLCPALAIVLIPIGSIISGRLLTRSNKAIVGRLLDLLWGIF